MSQFFALRSALTYSQGTSFRGVKFSHFGGTVSMLNFDAIKYSGVCRKDASVFYLPYFLKFSSGFIFA